MNNATPAPNVNINELVNNAYSRLCDLYAHTGKVSAFLRDSPADPCEKSGQSGSGEPTLIQKLQGIHQVIQRIEANMNQISSAIG